MAIHVSFKKWKRRAYDDLGVNVIWRIHIQLYTRLMN